MWHRVYPDHYCSIITGIFILDDKLAFRTVGDSASCGSTIRFVTESNTCVRQDERSHAISPQQEDSGMPGGSRDSAGGNEGSNGVLLWCVLL